jgi:TIR domain
MPLSLKSLKRHAAQYVEGQAHAAVLSVRFARRMRLFGQEDVILAVTIKDRTEPAWWVIGGSTPMNLYSQRDFPDPDVAYSLHHGLMLRIADKDFRSSRKAPISIGYDAFISHATEDKVLVARPLASALTALGYRIWYDEFELRVGDSLRRSIDKGLINSRFGIVVLSPSFFAKNWPQYELDGLTAREIDGKKVILPIWHKVSRKEVLGFSPTLADKVALSTGQLSIRRIAGALATVLEAGGGA